LLRDERSLRHAEVVQHFQSQLIGQREAIASVAEVLCRVKAGVAQAGKPLATFLFVGPTGVGKTELAKALARFLFGSVERLARFDMSEYRGHLAAERLIRGTDSGDGLLTRRVRQEPFTVLLLDEIEKADAGVFDLLLQVCGEGRLSDAQGKLAYFNNSIIIMTSNLGSQHQHAPAGFGSQAHVARDHYLQEVQQHFRSEFVNRLDRIVAFESLTLEQMREVTELSIERLRRREGLEERSVALGVSRAAALELAEDGYSGAYGARGLRRHLEQALVGPLASVLAGLGARASGTYVSVRVVGEQDDERRGPELRRLEHGRLEVVAYARPDPKRTNVAGAVEISGWRREVTRWNRLEPVSEVRERVAELTAELSSAERWEKERGSLSRVFGELSARHAHLSELVKPLDQSRAELEQIEAMVVTGLDEGGAPELFTEDAKAAHTRFQEALIPACLGLNTDDEITLVVHELDDERALGRWLVPLLHSIRERRWEVRLHLDRDARDSGWPKERRWGPARTSDESLKRLGSGQERPFHNVLVRVRGHAAGALLSFTLGRWRYPLPKPGEAAQLWVRFGAARYELPSDAFDTGQLNPEIDIPAGRKQPLCIDCSPDRVPNGPDEFAVDVDETEIFRHFERVFFPLIVKAIASAQPFLPVGGR
jgi:ATP-dependent Clp protease ATP-binding subunit ClpC